MRVTSLGGVIDVVGVGFPTTSMGGRQHVYARSLPNGMLQKRNQWRWVLISGKQYQPDAIKELAGAANPVTLNFDLRALKLPERETNHKLKNVAIFFVSLSPLDVDAQFSATQPLTDVNITFKQGIAMSNIPPTINDPIPSPLPLNALADFAADQRFTLFVDKNENVGVDFSGVSDVVLAVEYAADLS